MSDGKRVLVTGAAGGLGRHVVRHLHDLGHDVVALDVRPRDVELPVEVHEVDLAESDAAAAWMDGADGIVHLANHPNESVKPPRPLLAENLTMNVNVFQAAFEKSVPRVIFASSVQVIASEVRVSRTDSGFAHAYLPLDSDTPANPLNHYGMSKRLSENMLDMFVPLGLPSAVSFRFPWLCDPEQVQRAEQDAATTVDHPGAESRVRQMFSLLPKPEAARLLSLALDADLIGHHIYFPTETRHYRRMPIPQVIQRYYPDVALKHPIDQIETLVDVSKITTELGWSPSSD